MSLECDVTSMERFIDWKELLSTIAEIQSVARDSYEAGSQHFWRGAGYQLWLVRGQYYHPLLSKFPDGFLLLHFLSESDDVAGSHPATFSLSLTSRDVYRCPTSHMSEPTPLLIDVAPPSDHPVNKMFAQNGPSDGCNGEHVAFSSKEPLLAVIDRRLVPLPLAHASVTFLLLRRALRLQKIPRLHLPVVALISDPAATVHNWDLAFEPERNATEQEQLAQTLYSSDNRPCEGVCDLAETTPAPIRPTLVTPCKQRRDADGSTEEPATSESDVSMEASEVSFAQMANWATLSRVTHIALYAPDLSKESTRTHTTDGFQGTYSETQSPSTSENSPPQTLTYGRSLPYRVLTLRVPVLPQSTLYSRKPPALARHPEGHTTISVGSFLSRVIPGPILQQWQKEFSRPALRGKLRYACHSHQPLNQGIREHGYPIASSRFDLLKEHPIWSRLRDVEEGKLLLNLLARRTTQYDPGIMPGPFIALQCEWAVRDPWVTPLYPNFPNPGMAASGNSTSDAASIVFRTGPHSDTFLFWLWADLSVLRILREYRLQLAEEISQSAPHTVNLADMPLASACVHAEEEEILRAALLKETVAQAQEATAAQDPHPIRDLGIENNLGYLLLSAGQLLPALPGFLNNERRTGQGTVRRRVETHPSLQPAHQETSDARPSQNHKQLTQTLPPCPSLVPPLRSDMDFVDRLWKFLRRGHSLIDMYHVMQQIFNALERSILSSRSESPSAPPPAFPSRLAQGKRRSLLERDAPTELLQSLSLLPSVRKNGSSKLATLVHLAVRICQIRRYQRTGLGEPLSSATSTWDTAKPLTPSPDNTSHIDELERLEDEWRRQREHYTQFIPCVDLIFEIGVETLFRDATELIRHVDPSTATVHLEWFADPNQPFPTLLARLSRLHKLAEVAALSQFAGLSWDPTRVLLRQALTYFQFIDSVLQTNSTTLSQNTCALLALSCRSLSDDEDPGGCPLFSVPLNRQAFRGLFRSWAKRQPEATFSLRLGNVVEATFCYCDGKSDQRLLRRFFDIYPKQDPTPVPDSAAPAESISGIPENQHPLYIWNAFQRRDPTEDVSSESVGFITQDLHQAENVAPSAGRQTDYMSNASQLSYTLHIAYEESVI